MTWNIVKDYMALHKSRQVMILKGGGVILGIFLLLYVMAYFAYSGRIQPEFNKIQQSEIEAEQHLLSQLIANEHSSLATSVADWGYWDQPYNFIEGTNPNFPIENITQESLNNLKVHDLVLIDNQNKVLAGMYLNHENVPEVTIPAELKYYIDNDSWYRGMAEGNSGVVKLSDGFAFVAIYPITNSLNPDDKANGWILMVRHLNSDLIDAWEAFGTLDIYQDSQMEKDETKAESLEGAKLYEVKLVDVLGRDIGALSLANKQKVIKAADNLTRTITLISALAVIVFALLVMLLWFKVNLSDEKRQMLVQHSMAVVQEQNKKLVLTQEQLSQKVSEIVGQAKEMEDTKAAMLNLLDDGRELEEQLKIEKAGVERKVAERTRDLEAAKKQLTDSWLEQQQEKARLLASINGLSMGFVLTNDKAEVILSNTAVGKVLHNETGEWTMEKLSEIFLGNYDVRGQWQFCLDNQKQIEQPEILVGDKYVRLLMTPVTMNHDGGLSAIGVVILIEDIDEAKQLQKSRDEFFAVASHELRTPLTAIRGNMSLFKDYFPQIMENPEVKQMVEDTHAASIRLIAIVNDFLDASRLELNKMVFKTEEFDLNQLADRIINEMRVNANEKGLGWEWQKMGEGALTIKTDKNRTEQIIVNLLGNALKFTTTGKVKLETKIENEVLKIRVIDTGKGIPLDQQDLLFKKFQQTSSSVYTRDVSGGTGLGLYVSRLLAEGMGGKLYLEHSEPGVGSVFCFEIPMIRS